MRLSKFDIEKIRIISDYPTNSKAFELSRKLISYIFLGFVALTGVIMVILWSTGTLDSSNSFDRHVFIGPLDAPTLFSSTDGVRLVITSNAALNFLNPKYFVIEMKTDLAETSSEEVGNIDAATEEPADKSLESAAGWVTFKKIPHGLVVEDYLEDLDTGIVYRFRYRVEFGTGSSTYSSPYVELQVDQHHRLSIPRVLFFRESEDYIEFKVVKTDFSNFAAITEYEFDYRCGDIAMSGTVKAKDLKMHSEVEDNEFGIRYRKDFILRGPIFRVPCTERGSLVKFSVKTKNAVQTSDNSEVFEIVKGYETAIPCRGLTWNDRSLVFKTNLLPILSWTKNIPAPQKYLFRIASSSMPQDFRWTFSVSGNQNKLPLRLRNPDVYTVEMKSVSNETESEWSSPLTIETKDCLPDTQEYIKVRDISSNGFSVTHYPNPNNFCQAPSLRLAIKNFQTVVLPIHKHKPTWWEAVGVLRDSEDMLIVASVYTPSNGRYHRISTPLGPIKLPEEGKCTTRDALRWWLSTYSTDDVDGYNAQKFVHAFFQCLLEDVFEETCLKNYVSDEFNLPFKVNSFPEECLDCFQKNIVCIRNYCSHSCRDKKGLASKDCAGCQKEHCTDSFYECSGLTRNIAPPDFIE